MEILLAIAAVLAIPISVVVLFVGQSRLRARTRGLESAVERLTSELEELRRVRPAAEPPTQPDAAAVAEPDIAAAAPSAPDAAVTPEAVAGIAASPWTRPASPVVPSGTVEPSVDQDRPLVMRRDRFGDLVRWLQHNWVYAVSALSLALAGVFFVQYGIERGLLPPAVRVALAVLFGAALILGGEGVRRRFGGAAGSTTAYLPEVFSGAGLVSIFAGLVAGRLMYGLYGPEATFAGLLVTAALGVGLGWRNGPLLVAIGLLGAAATPFLVAGPGGAGPWLYGYYALIAATGLAVDAVRRWAWVSVLALLLGYGGGYLMMEIGAGPVGWAALLVGLALLAVALPVLRLVPDHEGPSLLEAVLARGRTWPPFPVRLAAGAVAVSSLGLAAYAGGGATGALLVFGAPAFLAVALLVWADGAPGLADLAALPAAGLLLRLVTEGLGQGVLSAAYSAQAIALRTPESGPPWTASGLLALAVLISLAAFWRAFREERFRFVFGVAAVVFAPLAVLTLDQAWQPVPVLGAYFWALHVMAVAGLMVAFALRFAARDGEDRRRLAYATLAALSLIALALFLVTTKAALTLALSVLLVGTAALDRRFRLPELGWFVQLGVAVLGWRVTVDPGLGWAFAAALPALWLTFSGVIGATLAALFLLRPLERRVAKGVLESGAAGFAALFANVLITRALGYRSPIGIEGTALELTLNAMPWLILMLVQLYRMPLGGPLRHLRMVLAGVAGLLAGAALAAAALPMNPLFAWSPESRGAMVRGPLVFDTLLVTYLLPALVLLAAALRMKGLDGRLRAGFAAFAAALAAIYVGLEIRRVWQGDFLAVPGVKQGELYSYTVALMLVGAGLLYQAIARRSALLRRIAMAVIGVTVAKVFLIDASGLTGLTRVISFLGLGLSLAGLALLNRWAGGLDGRNRAE